MSKIQQSKEFPFLALYGRSFGEPTEGSFACPPASPLVPRPYSDRGTDYPVLHMFSVCFSCFDFKQVRQASRRPRVGKIGKQSAKTDRQTDRRADGQEGRQEDGRKGRQRQKQTGGQTALKSQEGSFERGVLLRTFARLQAGTSP
jgi:hypothetical protein